MTNGYPGDEPYNNEVNKTIERPDGEITNIASQLSKATAQLSEEFAGLGDKLRPILAIRPSETSKVGDAVPGRETDLGQNLQLSLDTIRMVIAAIQIVREQAEL